MTALDLPSLLFDGAGSTVIASIVTIAMALVAVHNERASRADERRVDLATTFIRTMDDAARALPSRDPAAILVEARPAMMNAVYLYGMYGRFKNLQPYAVWLRSEITQFAETLAKYDDGEQVSESDLDDLLATTSVITSSTIDWIMLRDPRQWRPSTEAREILARQRQERSPNGSSE